MQSFDKSVYEKRIAAEMREFLVPDVDNLTLNSVALCVSNALNSEVRAQMGLKTNRSCASSENCVQCEPWRKTNDENGFQINAQESLDGSTFDLGDSLNSTFSPSQLDSTYTCDDSITVANTTVRSKTTNTDTCKASKSASRKSTDKQHVKAGKPKTKENEYNAEKLCLEDCNVKTQTRLTQCNICMTWFYDQCVGIKKGDIVGWWCCGSCRQMPSNLLVMFQCFNNQFSGPNNRFHREPTGCNS